RTLTVIVPGLPISWSRQPGASSFGIWPLFYASTKFGWAAPLLGTFRVGDPDKGSALGSVAFLYWWSRHTKEGKAADLLVPLFYSSRSRDAAFTVVPPLLGFYWRTKDDASTLAIPFFYAHSWKSGNSLYTPIGYAWRSGGLGGGAFLWAYWFGRDQAAGTAYDVVFPLLWSFRGRDSGTSIFFPLVWDFRGPQSRTTIAGPLVHVRRGGLTIDTFALAWWSGASAEGGWRFRMLLPLFFWQEQAHGKRSLWVSPIGGYSRDDDARSRTFLFLPAPVIVRRDPLRELDVFTPLYIRHHDRDA